MTGSGYAESVSPSTANPGSLPAKYGGDEWWPSSVPVRTASSVSFAGTTAPSGSVTMSTAPPVRALTSAANCSKPVVTGVPGPRKVCIRRRVACARAGCET